MGDLLINMGNCECFLKDSIDTKSLKESSLGLNTTWDNTEYNDVSPKLFKPKFMDFNYKKTILKKKMTIEDF